MFTEIKNIDLTAGQLLHCGGMMLLEDNIHLQHDSWVINQLLHYF